MSVPLDEPLPGGVGLPPESASVAPLVVRPRLDALSPLERLEALRARWDETVRAGRRGALWALGFATVIGGSHLARVGHLPHRVAAGGLLVLSVTLVVGLAVRRRRRASDPRAVLDDVLSPIDPELAKTARRALSLADRTAQDDQSGSPALAALHFTRVLRRAPDHRIEARAGKWAAAVATFGLLVGCAAAATVAWEPQRVLEGLDVLAARRGLAPLPIPWLEGVTLVAQPPDYIRRDPVRVRAFGSVALWTGSTITVRGRPLYKGRALFLGDGATSIPLEPDGTGYVQARWVVQQTGELQIFARFGDVEIRQPERQSVTNVVDAAPYVRVEGAPTTLRLLDTPSVSVVYEVTDDHGLRQVDLVLRAGPREDRRLLSKPIGQKTDRGSYELKATDPFFKNQHLPVEITVQARDNSPAGSVVWGKSEPILVVPPAIGEPEALRYAGLLRARDALVDLLAARVAARDAKVFSATFKAEEESQKEALRVLHEAVAAKYGGLFVRGAALNIARSRAKKLDKALAQARAKWGPEAYQALVLETETGVLAFDSALRMIGTKDAQKVSLRLAEVAEEFALGFDEARRGRLPIGPATSLRLGVARGLLAAGGKKLAELGDLGADLGDIVTIGLRRTTRAEAGWDYLHAELAARDLAERLKRPHASFEGGGGTEGGGAQGPSKDDASGAAGDQAAMEQALEELIREHGAETDSVSQALDDAIGQDDIEQLKGEAKKHAKALREAVKELPGEGDVDSAEGAAAGAKAQAESMAEALEAGRPSDAVQSGKGAMRSLEEAKKRGQKAQNDERAADAGKAASKAVDPVGKELEWAEKALEQLREKASERAKTALGKSGKNERKHGERAKSLREKGQAAEGSDDQLDRLEQAEQKMRDAARALDKGEGDKGLKAQKEAQKLLEMARGETEGQESQKGDKEGQRGAARDAKIPDKKNWKGPEELRRRVLEGLKNSNDPVLREAIRRYAEGLLK